MYLLLYVCLTKNLINLTVQCVGKVMVVCWCLFCLFVCPLIIFVFLHFFLKHGNCYSYKLQLVTVVSYHFSFNTSLNSKLLKSMVGRKKYSIDKVYFNSCMVRLTIIMTMNNITKFLEAKMCITEDDAKFLKSIVCRYSKTLNSLQLKMSSRDDDDDDKDDSSGRVGIFHDISKEDLKPGDHIYCYRLGFIYSHHGIYIGEEDCEVIHFAGEDGSLSSKCGSNDKKKGAYIRKCTLEEFTKGHTIRLVAYSVPWLTVIFKKNVSVKQKQSQSPAEVIERAKRYLQNPERWGEYNLIKNNCETFAVYCKTHIPENLAAQGKFPIIGGYRNRLIIATNS